MSKFIPTYEGEAVSLDYIVAVGVVRHQSGREWHFTIRLLNENQHRTIGPFPDKESAERFRDTYFHVVGLRGAGVDF
jgi:hypothetical protein